MVSLRLSLNDVLPQDSDRALLVGRAWLPGQPGGPTPIAVAGEQIYDLSALAPTVSQLLDAPNVAHAVRAHLSRSVPLGSLESCLAATEQSNSDLMHLLAPVDLQAIRACGVTFISSMLERVIEEQAHGDPMQAEALRKSIGEEIGAQISAIKPGSPAAMRLKDSLIKRGVWSQYLEVGIGPDAEVFNKAQPMSAVGTGAQIGILERSSWNNPEPELVLAVNSSGTVVGATLGNDVNLRDWEGRSALLLGRAKDNNASCAIGPFIRLLDEHFSVDDLRRLRIDVEVAGEDGFKVGGGYDLTQISRDPLDLVAQALNRNHQYPDGIVLFLGTAFAPTQDRGEPGRGFTHKLGDVVSIRSPQLGTLSNRIDYCDRIAPWTFGVGALMRNLAARGLLRG
ncbi:MAG TPA: fumarylacetoacetate hydrolase family protein [Burkholderiales bacterium]|nr:fumarylacetoacetate hydrolase family protein [Burkholderiales bacterium]